MKELVGQGKPFYSAMDMGARALKRKIGTGAEFLKELMALPGVKPTELKERGLEGLMVEPKMTHEQFLGHLASKPAPAIREKEFKEHPGEKEWFEQVQKNALQDYGVPYGELDHEQQRNVEKYIDLDNTHHKDYTLPGGENYREMLIKAPKGMEEFQGVNPHFGGEPGILASMRLKDRLGPNGEKLLHLEELQSDWHQKGREKGYKNINPKKITNPDGTVTVQFTENGQPSTFKNDSYASDAINTALMNVRGSVPDAPFKKNWEEMALKRLVHHAAEKGYHGIVITPGQEQADRYGLDKHVDNLTYSLNPDGTFRLSAKSNGNNHLVGESLTPEQIEQHVGKEIAEKIVGGVGREIKKTHYSTNTPMPSDYELSGLDLKIGGKGMKSFYDNKVPNILNNIGKKYGVRTELYGHNIHTPKEDSWNIEDAANFHGMTGTQYLDHPDRQRLEKQFLQERNKYTTPVHYFPITEPMRADVLKNGLPLYNQGGIVHLNKGGQPSLDTMKYALTMNNGLYSPAEKAVAGLSRKKGTGAEFMAELSKQPGYKKHEVEDRRLDRLAQLPKMSKEEFFENMQKGTPAPALKVKINRGMSADDLDYAMQEIAEREGIGISAMLVHEDIYEAIKKQALEEFGENVLEKDKMHHKRFAQEGGENYAEHLLIDPKLEKEGFTADSGHFGGIPGIVASLMTNDRKGPNGENVFHVDELQSDLHQLGRKHGYQKNMPDAPFKHNWDEMALKYALKHAVDNGYDKLAFSTGNQIADKYGKQETYHKLQYNPDTKVLFGLGNDNKFIRKENIEPQDLHKHVGKELTQRLLQAPREMYGDFPQSHTLEGDTYKVGGEGLKSFYDIKVPSIMDKLGKPYGVKTQMNAMPLNPRQSHTNNLHTFDITPEMRQKIGSEGLPMYNKGGKVKKIEPTHFVHPKHIVSLHGVEDENKLNMLKKSMQKSGYVGRPILAYDIGRGLEALTGSHRIQAAIDSGLENIPVRHIKEEIGNYLDKNGRGITDLREPEEIVNFLRKFGDKEAADLMKMEIKSEGLPMYNQGEMGHFKDGGNEKKPKITKKMQTVLNPQRVAFPGIYDRPDEIARQAAMRVAPEDPAMKQLFGVTRDDLYQMGKEMVGNLPGELPGAASNPRGSEAAINVMNPRNTQRLLDVMGEAEKHPELVKGMDPWYVMTPLFKHMVSLMGMEKAKEEFKKFNTLMGMASPGSEVMTEIPRGTAAYYLHKQGRFPDFVKYAGIPAGKRGSFFPKDIQNVPGHMYHVTSQADPMSSYIEHGEIQMDSPKVPMYIQASQVPEIGFQTRTPVGDAHWSRAIGLADTRGKKTIKGKEVVPGASVTNAEMSTLAPWWREKIAQKLGIESVPAQARAWGAFSPQTGVTTPVGAPKLELIAKQIMATANRLGISPDKARDMVLTGKTYAGKAEGGQVDIKDVGVEEAPNLPVKAYVGPTDGNTLPIGGVDMQPAMPGQQLMPQPPAQPGQQQGQPPQPPQPQGQPPQPQGGSLSNILQATPQGRALNTMQSPQPPQMARGGNVSVDAMRYAIMNRKR